MNRHVSKRSLVEGAPVVLTGRLEKSSDFLQVVTRATAIVEKAKPAIIRTGLIRYLPEHLRVRFARNRIASNGLMQSVKIIGQQEFGVVRYAPQDAAGTKYEVLSGEGRFQAVAAAGKPFRAIVIDCPDNELIVLCIAIACNIPKRENSIMEKSHLVSLLRDGGNVASEDIDLACGFGHGKEYIDLLYRLRKLTEEAWKYGDESTAPEGRPLNVNVLGALATAEQKYQAHWARVAHSERLSAPELNARMREQGHKTTSHSPLADKVNKGKRAVSLSRSIASDVAEVQKLIGEEDIPRPLPSGHPYVELRDQLERAKKGIEALLGKFGPHK